MEKKVFRLIICKVSGKGFRKNRIVGGDRNFCILELYYYLRGGYVINIIDFIGKVKGFWFSIWKGLGFCWDDRLF